MIGERIKQIRQEKGITQDQLAKAIGCKNKSSISQIEKSGNNVWSIHIYKIAKALDCSVSDIVGEDLSVLDDFFVEKITPIKNEPYDKKTNKMLKNYEQLNCKNRQIINKLVDALLKEQEDE